MSTDAAQARRWQPALGIGLAICVLLVATVSVGARTPASHGVSSPQGSSRLDYSRDSLGRLRPLSRKFLAETLGSLAALRSPAPSGPADIPLIRPLATAAGPFVSTPQFHCVNGHQTEDPLSPSCVSAFRGNNGGATYQGVTGDEVRLLVMIQAQSLNFLFDPSFLATSGHGRGPSGTYYDLAQPPSPGDADFSDVHNLRVWQGYFNRRFQTFGRRVHFYAYFSSATTADEFREEAIENDAVVHPFAVALTGSGQTSGTVDQYKHTLAERGVASFDLREIETNAQTRQYAGLLWTYRPSAEQSADLFASYLCKKVVTQPVVLSGNLGDNGKRRRVGLVLSDDPELPNWHRVGVIVERRVRSCGGSVADVATYRSGPNCLSDAPRQIPQTTSGQDVALRQMAKFRADGVTTILWPGCFHAAEFDAAAGLGYVPEWIVYGDTDMDSRIVMALAPGAGTLLHRHAIVVTPQVFEPVLPQRTCFTALRDADPTTAEDNVATSGCDMYSILRQIFTGIQLAGPRLTPAAIDVGFARYSTHAAASDPQIPTCYHLPGDYSCVKDAEVAIWDATAPPYRPSAATAGCWRAIENGKRYLPGNWPAGNVDAQITGHEPCNQF